MLIFIGNHDKGRIHMKVWRLLLLVQYRTPY